MNIKNFIYPVILAVIVTAISYAGLEILGLMKSWNFGEKLIFIAVSSISSIGAYLAIDWIDNSKP